jgi:hypothetical protein
MSDATVLGSDASRAVGRFSPDGPTGYRASTAPDAPLRETRAEAVADEWAYRMLARPIKDYPNRIAVSFTSESGGGLATFRDGDHAREFLATDQSEQIHEAARRYLDHIGASAPVAEPTLFDMEGIA